MTMEESYICHFPALDGLLNSDALGNCTKASHPNANGERQPSTELPVFEGLGHKCRQGEELC